MTTTLYPPVLEKSLPAFDKRIENYKISFQLPSFISYSDIGHIQIKINSQNGESLGNPSLYPDHIIYKDISQISQMDNSLTINTLTDLREGGWTEGSLYKIQMRLGEKRFDISSDAQNYEYAFNVWKQTIGSVSEWSNLLITKALEAPTVQIVSENSSIEITDMPTFYGMVLMPEINNEIIDKVKYDIYEEGVFLETSNWIAYSDSGYRFKHKLSNDKNYSAFFSIHTLNNYEKTSSSYEFKIAQTALGELNEVSISAKENKESGYIELFMTSTESQTGIFVISRASEKDDYLVWEDIRFLNYSKATSFDKTLIYKDFLVENGVKYKYAIQQERTSFRTKSVETDAVSVNYEYAFLSDGVHQLALKYDTKLSSFKKTVLATKQDTIGSLYPTIMRNGAAYYAEFPISGTISLNQDLEENTFLTKKEIVVGDEVFYEYYYDNELLFTLEEEYILNLPRERQTYLEKVFRDKVEQFLNNGNYKIYRSSTEGNFIVSLINVSLAPKENLERMIYSFSATAYEVAPFDISFLREIGVINSQEEILKEKNENEKEQVVEEYFGQLVDSDEDIISVIQNEIAHLRVREGYEYQLLDITSIKIESNNVNPVRFLVNNKEFLLAPNHSYILTNKDSKINNVKIIEGKEGASIMYTYNTKLILKSSQYITKTVFFQEWGQIENIWNQEIDILDEIRQEITNKAKNKYNTDSLEVIVDGFSRLKIETTEGVKFSVNDTREIVIGPTGIYELTQQEALGIKKLVLKTIPAYVIVDYICIVEVDINIPKGE